MYLQSSRNRVSSTDFCGNLVKLDFEPDLWSYWQRIKFLLCSYRYHLSVTLGEGVRLYTQQRLLYSVCTGYFLHSRSTHCWAEFRWVKIVFLLIFIAHIMHNTHTHKRNVNGSRWANKLVIDKAFIRINTQQTAKCIVHINIYTYLITESSQGADDICKARLHA